MFDQFQIQSVIGELSSLRSGYLMQGGDEYPYAKPISFLILIGILFSILNITYRRIDSLRNDGNALFDLRERVRPNLDRNKMESIFARYREIMGGKSILTDFNFAKQGNLQESESQGLEQSRDKLKISLRRIDELLLINSFESTPGYERILGDGEDDNLNYLGRVYTDKNRVLDQIGWSDQFNKELSEFLFASQHLAGIWVMFRLHRNGSHERYFCYLIKRIWVDEANKILDRYQDFGFRNFIGLSGNTGMTDREGNIMNELGINNPFNVLERICTEIRDQDTESRHDSLQIEESNGSNDSSTPVGIYLTLDTQTSVSNETESTSTGNDQVDLI